MAGRAKTKLAKHLQSITIIIRAFRLRPKSCLTRPLFSKLGKVEHIHEWFSSFPEPDCARRPYASREISYFLCLPRIHPLLASRQDAMLQGSFQERGRFQTKGVITNQDETLKLPKNSQLDAIVWALSTITTLTTRSKFLSL